MMLQIWHHSFLYFLLPVDVTVSGSFDFFYLVLLKFGGCLHSQIGVTSNGCLDNVNWLQFFYYSFINMFAGWVVSANNRKTASRFDYHIF